MADRNRPTRDYEDVADHVAQTNLDELNIHSLTATETIDVAQKQLLCSAGRHCTVQSYWCKAEITVTVNHTILYQILQSSPVQSSLQ